MHITTSMYIFNFKKDLFLLSILCIYTCVYSYTCLKSACGGHRKQFNNLELELKVVIVHPIQVMATEPSPLQKQEMHVTMDLSLQPQK